MATETLRPGASGDECNIDDQSGALCPDHYQNVDEAVADDGTTNVKTTSNTYLRDLYNIEPSGVGAGTINSIKVYVRTSHGAASPNQDYAKIAIKSGTTVAEGTAFQDASGAWTNHDFTWANDPDTSAPWTWAAIDALQIGIALRSTQTGAGTVSRCTQVYVEIDYTTGWAGGDVNGVAIATIAKINGVALADITKVNGV